MTNNRIRDNCLYYPDSEAAAGTGYPLPYAGSADGYIHCAVPEGDGDLQGLDNCF